MHWHQKYLFRADGDSVVRFIIILWYFSLVLTIKFNKYWRDDFRLINYYCTLWPCHGLQFYFVLPSSYDIFTKTFILFDLGSCNKFSFFLFSFSLHRKRFFYCLRNTKYYVYSFCYSSRYVVYFISNQLLTVIQ